MAAVLAGGLGVQASQEVSPLAQGSFFRSAIDLVTLHVTVTDRSGKYLNDVQKREFMVFENGRRQELALFQTGGLPLAVALLVDTSSSVEHRFPEVQAAAIDFLRQLHPSDVASVMAFGDTMRVLQIGKDLEVGYGGFYTCTQ